jgi:hypothetical protein
MLQKRAALFGKVRLSLRFNAPVLLRSAFSSLCINPLPSPIGRSLLKRSFQRIKRRYSPEYITFNNYRRETPQIMYSRPYKSSRIPVWELQILRSFGYYKHQSDVCFTVLKNVTNCWIDGAESFTRSQLLHPDMWGATRRGEARRYFCFLM